MVNAGLLPTTVVNEWTAKLWAKLLPKIKVHGDIVIGPDVAFAWAVRNNSPQLLATINDFLKTHRQGTQFGNQIVNKYVTSTYMLKQATSPESMKRFDQTAQTFRKYSDRYGADYLLMMAEGYQESGLNQQVKSKVGAVGVMQLMPATGKEMNVGDITQEEANIHAGIKYFNATKDRLYANEPMDNVNKILFIFAAYNCGPARVKQLRAEAQQKGLDPNVWLNNVEFIAAAGSDRRRSTTSRTYTSTTWLTS
jgi:membrane-bound lytic murein transglycosylase MltF